MIKNDYQYSRKDSVSEVNVLGSPGFVGDRHCAFVITSAMMTKCNTKKEMSDCFEKLLC